MGEFIIFFEYLCIGDRGVCFLELGLDGIFVGVWFLRLVLVLLLRLFLADGVKKVFIFWAMYTFGMAFWLVGRRER